MFSQMLHLSVLVHPSSQPPRADAEAAGGALVPHDDLTRLHSMCSVLKRARQLLHKPKVQLFYSFLFF